MPHEDNEKLTFGVSKFSLINKDTGEEIMSGEGLLDHNKINRIVEFKIGKPDGVVKSNTAVVGGRFTSKRKH